jgi:hypothetical protein
MKLLALYVAMAATEIFAIRLGGGSMTLLLAFAGPLILQLVVAAGIVASLAARDDGR